MRGRRELKQREAACVAVFLLGVVLGYDPGAVAMAAVVLLWLAGALVPAPQSLS